MWKQTLVRLHLAQFGMAASAAAFVYVNASLLQRQLALTVYAAAFFGTWAIYLWDARDSFSVEDRINQPLRAALFEQYRAVVRWLAPASLAVAALCLLPALSTPIALPALAALGVCGLAYVFPLIPLGGGRFGRVKDVPFLKMAVINLAWAAGGVGVPLLLGQGPPPPTFLGALFAVHLALLTLDTFALNYRDREGDAAAQLTTIAVLVGPRGLRWLRVGAAVTLVAAFCLPNPLRLVEGAMALELLGAVLAVRRLEKHEVAFSMAVGGWRFVGAIVYFFWYGQ